MKILEYIGFDASRHQSQYQKVVAALTRGDFRGADVKKLTYITHGKFYRAKLDYTNRLLFTLVRFGEEVCCLMLEVIENHAYDKSRFLRGAQLDENKLPDFDLAKAAVEAEPVRYIHPERREIHLLDKVILRRRPAGCVPVAAAPDRGRFRRQRQDRADPGKAETCRWRGVVRHPFRLPGTERP